MIVIRLELKSYKQTNFFVNNYNSLYGNGLNPRFMVYQRLRNPGNSGKWKDLHLNFKANRNWDESGKYFVVKVA